MLADPIPPRPVLARHRLTLPFLLLCCAAGFASPARPAPAPFPGQAERSSLDAAGIPWRLAAGDLNRDGAADLISLNHAPASLSVWIGRGAGEFDPRRDVALPRAALDLGLADLDGDRIPDLVVLDQFGLSTFIGHGDGTFRPDSVFALSDARDFSFGDVNADGHVDIALVGSYGIWGYSRLLTGRGDGSFLAASVLGGEPDPAEDALLKREPFEGVVLADLTGDGNEDMAILKGTLGGAYIEIYAGNGAGEFSYRDYADGSGASHTFLAEDLNGDGRLDLIAPGGPEGVAVFFDSESGFESPTLFPGGSGSPLAVADGNRDGRVDLLISNPRFDGLSLLLGDDAGGFEPGPEVISDGRAGCATVADLDGDGWPDVALGSQDSPTITVVRARYGSIGSGVTRWASVPAPVTIVATDLDRDGHHDLVVGDALGGGLGILNGAADGTFRPGANLRVLLPDQTVMADFDGDRFVDVAAATSFGMLALHPGRGDGTFAQHRYFPVAGNALHLAAADLNGDGRSDLVMGNTTGGVSVMLGEPGGLQPPAHHALDGPAGRILIADVDHDGAADVITSTGSILLGNGDGSFRSGPGFAAAGATHLGVADFDRDRNLDLILVTASGWILLAPGLDAGGFGPTVPVGRTPVPTGLAVADLDGNGFSDAAITTRATDTVHLLLGRPGSPLGTSLELPGGPGLGGIAIADFDGDGSADLATANTSEGAVRVRLGARRAIRAEPEAGGPPAPEEVAARLRVVAHPNPGRHEIRFRMTTPDAGRARLRVLDLAGRAVRTLVDAELPAGEHRFDWDGRSGEGAPLAPGLYFYEAAASGRRVTERLVLIH